MIEAVRFGVGGGLVDTLDSNNREFDLANGEATSGPYTADGSLNQLDQSATISSGATERLELRGLQDNESDVDTGTLDTLQYAPNASDSDADLFVVLEFSDGSQTTLHFQL